MSRDHGQITMSFTGPRPPVSVVILTLNEEINIEDCLASCSWCDDVHVLDSGSEDRTVEMARSLGASAHTNPFTSFGEQRNWAIDNIPLRYDWVFHLDADERFTEDLIREIDGLLKTEPPEAGYHVPHKLMFMGQWLRRSGGYPTYQMRLFHKERMRFCDYGHGQREATDGTVGRLKSPYLHFSFSKGIYDWIEKHNRYSSLEALQTLESGAEGLAMKSLFGGDPVQRRRAWKLLTSRLPMRSQLRWFVTVFAFGGILEGRPGLAYARLLAMYEQMISLKLKLLRHAARTSAPSFERDNVPTVPTRVYDAGDSQIDLAGRDGSPLATPNGAARRARRPETAPLDETGQLVPEASPWTFKEKVVRAIWMLVGRPLFRLSFHNWYGFRARLLRLFGARIGREVCIRPTVNVEIPWNLEIHDGVTVGDYAILYSLGKISIGERTIISQYAHLCAGTHDHTDRRFPLIRDPIAIGADAWIGADAFVGPNVTIGRLSVLGARSSAYKDLEAENVYVGNPAKRLKRRELA